MMGHRLQVKFSFWRHIKMYNIMKTITIEGEINPQMLDNIGKQFEEQHISEGDDVEVLFDTEGGYVDVAFAIADLFTDMQSSGILCTLSQEIKCGVQG